MIEFYRSLAAALVLAAGAVPSGAAHAVERDVSHDVRECQEDPRFGETGGAMIGDCLLEISEQVDAEIKRIIARSAKAYCRKEDRSLLVRTQSNWQTYRQGFCELVERSPGNTPAYVNSAACMLSAGRKRLADLAYIVDYGQANCPYQKLLLKDSRFGNPAGVSVEMSSMPLTWKARAQDDKLTLEFSRNERSDDSLIGNVELTGCIFCPDGKEDCDDGVFFTETYGVNSANHSMFYVCHMADGARRLEQFHLSGTLGPFKEREVTEEHGFAWSVDLRELKVVPTNSPRTLIRPDRAGDAQ
ncbi:lysozyme inhibitor LprI family protein [Aquamicrobium terrae]|uniref:Uncharacterized protein YecT (DUF1311 family) n=1 Tax=Aquamicrobium terrae TaxID=1324945 RepID=A0ABV2MW76_9HYPH